MDNDQLDQPDQSETRSASTGSSSNSKGKKTAKTEVIDLDSDMEVDENKEPEQTTTQGKKGKTVAASKRKSGAQPMGKDESGSENEVVVTSKQAKRPKLDNAKTSSSSAVKGAATSSDSSNALVSFKNNKLVIKQKKIDFANRNEWLEKRMAWNRFLEDVDDALAEIPEEHYPLLALMVHESEKQANELAKQIKAALSPAATGDEDSQQTVEIVSTAILSKAIKQIAERVNHGFRDPDPEADDEEDRDLPEGYETVPTHLKVWRWEVINREGMFGGLPGELREKIESRIEERGTIRELAKKLLASLSEKEQKDILTIKGKGGETKEKEKDKDSPAPAAATKKATKSATAAEKGKKKKAESEAEDGEDDKGEGSSTGPKKKASKKKKELTEEEQAEEDEKQRKKEEDKAEKARKKLERDAAKALKDAAKAEKDAIKQRKEELEKKQKNAFGSWLFKNGTSPELQASSTPAKSMKPRSSSSSTTGAGEAGGSGVKKEKEKKEINDGQDYRRAFRPFKVRQGVEVAPINRFLEVRKQKNRKKEKGNNVLKLESDDEETEESDVEMDIEEKPEPTAEESLKDFLSRAAKERIPSRNSKTREQHNVSDLMTAITEFELQSNYSDASRLRAILRNPSKIPMKLLKFVEDVRPGYYGTWTKKSESVNGRNPFKKDLGMLDYEYESEAEWDDDPEDAEDVENGSEEEKVESEDEDDLDGWLAGDDEQIEMEDGYEDMSMNLDPDDPFSAQAKRTTMKTAPKKKKVTGPLVAVIKGPYFEHEESDEDAVKDLKKYFETFKIQFLGDQKETTLDPFTKVEKKVRASLKSSIQTHNVPESSSSATLPTSNTVNTLAPKKPMLDPSLMPLFTKTVLASSTTTKPKLVDELVAVFADQKKVSRALLERQFAESIAKKTKEEASGGDCVWRMKVDKQE